MGTNRVARAYSCTSSPYGSKQRSACHAVARADGKEKWTYHTGGEVISISQASANALGKRDVGRKIQLRVYGSSGWDSEAFLLPGINLMFDAIQYRNFSVIVLNLDTPSALLGFQVGGIVGHKFLSNYRVSIDLEHSLLRLKKAA